MQWKEVQLKIQKLNYYKLLLSNALTDDINNRLIYMKGIDASYNYEGYNNYSVEELDKEK